MLAVAASVRSDVFFSLVHANVLFAQVFIVPFTPMDYVFGCAGDRAIMFKWIQAIKYISIYIHKP